MRRSASPVLTLVAVSVLAVAAAGPLSPFAVEVVAFQPGQFSGGDPLDTLGHPVGGGEFTGSSDVLQLGVNGSLTLRLGAPAVNGPGTDLVVYENPFHIAGQGTLTFVECLFVEVSTDGTHWARFPTRYSGEPGPFLPGGLMAGVPSAWYRGFAGVLPCLASVSAGVSPYDVVGGGGDAFDLSALADHPAVLAGDVDLDNVAFVRLRDVQGGTQVDSLGTTVWDAADPIFACADVDAVAALNNTVDIAGTALRPAVEMSLLELGGFDYLILELRDNDGLWTIVEGITASVDGIPLDFYQYLLGLFALVSADYESVTLAVGPIPPGMPPFQLRIGVVDFTGRRAGDAIDLP